MDHIGNDSDHAPELPTNVLQSETLRTDPWRDHNVFDDNGDKIGHVVDVLFDDVDMAPRWVVVDTGLLRADHFVPLDNSYRTEDGSVVVPYTKGTVNHSPKASGAHILSRDLEAQVRRHYGIAA